MSSSCCFIKERKRANRSEVLTLSMSDVAVDENRPARRMAILSLLERLTLKREGRAKNGRQKRIRHAWLSVNGLLAPKFVHVELLQIRFRTAKQGR